MCQKCQNTESKTINFNDANLHEDILDSWDVDASENTCVC